MKVRKVRELGNRFHIERNFSNLYQYNHSFTNLLFYLKYNLR